MLRDAKGLRLLRTTGKSHYKPRNVFPAYAVRSSFTNIPSGEKVTELLVASDLVIALFESGVARIYSRANGVELGSLLDEANQVVRSVCYNTWNDTLLVVWHSRCIDHGLRVAVLERSGLSDGTRGCYKGARDLQEIIVPFPGFVEFEERNARIVTSTPHDALYRFWDMRDYKALFSMSNRIHKELRLSGGTIAFFENPEVAALPVQLRRARDGLPLANTRISLIEGRALKLVELCGTLLLVKQDGANLRAHDLATGKMTKAAGTRDFRPRSVIFLPASEDVEANLEVDVKRSRFIALGDYNLDLFECDKGEVRRLRVFDIPGPPLRVNQFQMLHNGGIALMYMRGTRREYLRSSPSSCQLERASKYFAASGLPRQQGKRLEKPIEGSAAPCKADLRSQSMLDISPGILMFDLYRGEPVGFIAMTHIEQLDVMAYDAPAIEIFAAGLHRIYKLGPGFVSSNAEDSVCHFTSGEI